MSEPKIKVLVENVDGLTRRQVIDEVVERELGEFNSWLTETFRGTAPMASFEKAMVKSYVMWKIKGQIEAIKG
jgi:hypothetical protein